MKSTWTCDFITSLPYVDTCCCLLEMAACSHITPLKNPLSPSRAPFPTLSSMWTPASILIILLRASCCVKGQFRTDAFLQCASILVHLHLYFSIHHPSSSYFKFLHFMNVAALMVWLCLCIHNSGEKVTHCINHFTVLQLLSWTHYCGHRSSSQKWR